MKQSIRWKIFVLSLIAASWAPASQARVTQPVAASAMQEEVHKHESVGSQAFHDFHEVLHPLMHEAMPHKDFKTVRARAGELVKRGRVIVKAGLPQGVKDEAAFRLSLKDFDEELAAFRKAARGKDDSQLEKAFNALHDTFERLADMLPPK